MSSNTIFGSKTFQTTLVYKKEKLLAKWISFFLFNRKQSLKILMLIFWIVQKFKMKEIRNCYRKKKKMISCFGVCNWKHMKLINNQKSHSKREKFYEFLRILNIPFLKFYIHSYFSVKSFLVPWKFSSHFFSFNLSTFISMITFARGVLQLTLTKIESRVACF